MKTILFTAIVFFSSVIANAQWQPQNAGFINDTLGFYEMSLPNRHTAWAVCYDAKARLNAGRFILDFTRTTNGGQTWTPGKMGNDHSLQFSNISAIDETEAWVAMNKRFVTGGGLYHTVDGGINWEQSGVGEIFDENSFPNFVHFKDRNHGVAMGDPNAGYFEIYTTNNKGKKWKRVRREDIPEALPNEFGWISGYAAVGNTIWFGTSAGRIYKSTNFGKNWTAHTVDPAGKFVMEIAFNDDMLHGVAHLRSSQTFLYVTADGGVTWTNLGQPTNWKSSRITAVPGTHSFIATSVNGFDLGSSVSNDYGITWTVIESTVPKAVSRFYDANTGYAGSFFVTGPPFRGGIFKSEIVFETPADQKNILTARTALPVKSKHGDGLATVFPTPANDVINISLQNELVNTKSVISILSMDGKLMQSTRSAGSKLIQINVSKLPPGLYMLHIESNMQTTKKVITIVR